MPQISDRELLKMKQSLEELTTLNRIAGAINVSMSVDQITKTIVDHCCQRVHADQGAIFLLEQEDSQEDRFRTFVRETSATDGGIPFHLSLSLQGWMLKNRSILLTNDPDSDERIRGTDYAKSGLNNLLAAPLLSRRGIIGVLVLFNKKGDEGFDDRDKRFIGIVGTQVSKVIENAQLFEKERQLAEMEKDMSVAKTIQAGFLPDTYVTTDLIETFGFNIPAKSVGGDYYDLILLDDDKVFFSLGDVSGKGIPAALLTGNAQAVMRSQLHSNVTPDLPAIADCLNQLICHFTKPDQYITAVLGILDSKERKLSFINAGHLPPVVVHPDGSIEQSGQADLVIGVLPEVKYHTIDIDLKAGATVYVYTDGVTEAFNEAQEQFGDERFLELVRGTQGEAPEKVCNRVKDALTLYRGEAPQSDDITMLGLWLR
jgi:sigma-B regulation protein RsbU (phosphoserine phosphatase)